MNAKLILFQPFQGPPPVQGMQRPPGGPPQVMHNDPRGPRPDWNRPPGKLKSLFYLLVFQFIAECKMRVWSFSLLDVSRGNILRIFLQNIPKKPFYEFDTLTASLY